MAEDKISGLKEINNPLFCFNLFYQRLYDKRGPQQRDDNQSNLQKTNKF